jgi:hypothetical protein
MAEKRNPEYDRFTALVDRVIAVPKAVVQKRIEEEKRNPKRRSPKPKAGKP